MSATQERLREILTVLLLLIIVVLAISLWTLDISTMQSAFAALLGAELVAFALMGYIYLKPTYAEIGKGWFLLGCFLLTALLMIAL
jgi:hypothetical protein